MRTAILKRARLGLLLAMLILASAMPLASPTPAAAQTAPNIGLVCTTGGPNPTFTLTTRTGYILLPDGNTMFMWGYSEGDKGFQHPGPVLCVNEGDTVTIILKNTLTEDVSIMFPGQDNVTANGLPAQPQFDIGGNLTSLTDVAPANNGSVTYSFVASRPGTFIYESGTQPERQINMGLFGAIVVRPTRGANYANHRDDSQFVPEEEFLTLLSEIDPYLHQSVERADSGQPFDLNNYHARYWLLNGRGFPDTIADNFASRLPTQPYGALLRIREFNETDHPYPALAHYINVGTEDYPFHPHANNGVIIARDGFPLEGSAGQDLTFEKFAINLGPGQTWDVLFKWYDAEGYEDTPGKTVPVVLPDPANQEFGMFYSASPYLGTKGVLPPGLSSLNQCGEYYIISHNHALYQITSWGVTMTGPITYLRIDPPLPNTCPQ